MTNNALQRPTHTYLRFIRIHENGKDTSRGYLPQSQWLARTYIIDYSTRMMCSTQCCSHHLLEVWHSHTSSRIPADSSIPRGPWDLPAITNESTCLHVIPVAAACLSSGNIEQCTRFQAVNKRINKPHGGLSCLEARIIYQRYDSSNHRRCC
jgi:hypothetical protein